MKSGENISVVKLAFATYRIEMVRAAVTILLLLVLGWRGLLPSVPSYVCLGMGGKHLAQPCCPDEERAAQAATPTLRTRCCQHAPPPTLESQRQPPRPERALSAPPSPEQVALAQAYPDAALRSLTGPRMGRAGRPPPAGPPPPLRSVLRI